MKPKFKYPTITIVKHKIIFLIENMTEWCRHYPERHGDKELVKTCNLVTRDFKKFDNGQTSTHDYSLILSLYKGGSEKHITIHDTDIENYIHISQKHLQQIFDLLKENKFIKG